ncbi:MAG: AI-2E family transporter [Desulfosarcina sp.]|nr:AI-2E family transporter [Desulfosarcina sp.]
MSDDRVNKFVVVLLVVFISAIFLSMIRSFLMAIFLAAIFSALAVVLLPLAVLTGVVTGQAIKVGQSATPWVKAQISQPGAFSEFLATIPYYDKIAPHSQLILRKAGEMVGSISQFLINNLSSATMGAVSFLFMLFTWLYTMYFFLIDGEKLLEKILYYLPLQDHDEQQMLERFTSVTRATLKGTAVIGILQGGLAGVAFWVVGIPSAAFWGTIMVVLSIIPSVGTAVIWLPAAVILGLGGAIGKAVGLFVFCGLVVGSVDNLLRPILVGKDTQMHELMIFFGTLGGIFMFGIVGVVIGPIVAALFVTIWEIYGQAFQDMLPDTGYVLNMKQQEEALPDDDGAE